jgi:hypothetical protein
MCSALIKHDHQAHLHLFILFPNSLSAKSRFIACRPFGFHHGLAMDGKEPGSSPAKGKSLWLSPLWIVLGAALLLSTYLSPRPFWIDAPDYVSAMVHGRPVVHPPGYLGFLYLANLLNEFLGSPYRSLQWISTGCYLASIAWVSAAIRRHTTPAITQALTLAYATSWVCLNIATVGTSHASDLLFGGILVYLASLPRPTSASRWWHPALFLTLVWASSFRMSSVVMAGPFLVLVLLRDYRLPRFWISAAVGGLLIGLVAWITAQYYGGWEAYREASAAIHAVNARSGFLTGGSWKTGGMNTLRAGGWLFLAFPLLPFLALSRKQRRPGSISWPVLLPAALAGGVLFVNFGYLCVHPGYLAPALPALFVLLARLLQPTRILIYACMAQGVFTLTLFFVPKPILPPSSSSAAAANAFLLQFTASAHRNADTTLSLSSWLYFAGRSDLVPAHRRAKAEADLRKSSEFQREND